MRYKKLGLLLLLLVCFCDASRSVDNEAALKSYLTYISKMESTCHIVTLGRS